jgi:hypothetical protein
MKRDLLYIRSSLHERIEAFYRFLGPFLAD